ncbi:MAG: entry exclusion 1 domain-containing protein [Alphaproteobacteria bacterium]|nr:entry exclusion 1 domain-containing protein [Alphaproteobacteria bacterium]
MAKVGAQRAAVLTGKSKSTIQRAMNSGKLSYELDQNKRRIIDVSELERVFGIVQTNPQPTTTTAVATPSKPKSQDLETILEKERMAMQIKLLENQLSTSQDQIDDLRDQRDKWEKQASQMLITSQYSQRQAEDLRAQIKERAERARQKRLQMQNAKTKTPQQHSDVVQRRSESVQHSSVNKNRDLEAQMQKLKAQNENTSKDSASVFRFWKKARG